MDEYRKHLEKILGDEKQQPEVNEDDTEKKIDEHI